MILRERRLPVPWYPESAEKITLFLEGLPPGKEPRNALAAFAPHAGWFYSGPIAAAAVSALDPRAETVAVIGGHLPAGMPPLFAEEDGVRTPLGDLPIDGEFRDILKKALGGRPDRYQDNTVEILLPMVRYYFPRSRVLWIRLPAEIASLDAGELIARTAAALNRKTAVLGSTDLTHYGDNYGFSPRGRGKTALGWVREVNDAAFIQAVLEGDGGKILRRAEEDFSACSVGAVLGALGFARASGAGQARLLAYGTSADADAGAAARGIPDSFVGYGALSWHSP
ncbi:MAG: AmmeMemoRadiSam system protein B [Treponema sp.]|jgi:AmmeMemoRadiSam system protein B|nr:AmmeMemoRadiSam system protein B [Treponema sp.]